MGRPKRSHCEQPGCTGVKNCAECRKIYKAKERAQGPIKEEAGKPKASEVAGPDTSVGERPRLVKASDLIPGKRIGSIYPQGHYDEAEGEARLKRMARQAAAGYQGFHGDGCEREGCERKATWQNGGKFWCFEHGRKA